MTAAQRLSGLGLHLVGWAVGLLAGATSPPKPPKPARATDRGHHSFRPGAGFSAAQAQAEVLDLAWPLNLHERRTKNGPDSLCLVVTVGDES